ncbi:gamma-glutamylcyclotransferase [Brevirhabdus pacifica]|uniref:glutathione-specific gamma-glutamylcyclotransferase n=2 Tax=Brevirhabdus pacifica TaxID=1267768 RepID=A0A1U7DHA0_9RHOB|nr:gamma-glutamylcyclotransferase [Brevirhabdus pacifica]APX89258.1 gamma-glutamylcyclotransferase [Brevirhabdus pacifica]OWU76697.1 gamma-glutamyl cyclotransferase [Loktanella sp. 22II-4b]PJJ86133.1 cation transport protein ChaC [Brevirhabdus pacifica]
MQSPVWVFGYGSLMWNPEFPVLARQIARLEGYHRSFCMRSVHHRGTAEEPGLVLALDRQEGAHCDGVAFLMDDHGLEASLAALRARELVSAAYLETVQPLTLRDGRQVEALTYVIDPDHVQYCGGLPLEEQAHIIARARGQRGPNTEYLHNTASHLAELQLTDPELDWLARRVRELSAA